MTQEEFDSGRWIGEKVEIRVETMPNNFMNGQVVIALERVSECHISVQSNGTKQYEVHFNHLHLLSRKPIQPLPLPG